MKNWICGCDEDFVVTKEDAGNEKRWGGMFLNHARREASVLTSF